jgi:hypothetical protein
MYVLIFRHRNITIKILFPFVGHNNHFHNGGILVEAVLSASFNTQRAASQLMGDTGKKALNSILIKLAKLFLVI